MLFIRRHARWFVLSLTLALGTASTAVAVQSCASITPAPTGLSAAGVVAFNQTRLVKALDVIRDTAISANAQPKPLISTDETRIIVQLHKTTLETIQASATGWQDAVKAAVDGAVKTLSAATQALIQPDVALFETLLQELK